MRKQLFLSFLCAISSATIVGADEYKKKTTKDESSQEKNTSATAEVQRNAIMAFMVTTVLPIAEMGEAIARPQFSLWTNSDTSGRECNFMVTSNDVQVSPDVNETLLCLKKNTYELQSTSLPSCLAIGGSNYKLNATTEKITLEIKSGTLARHKALFQIKQKKSDVKFPEITSESITAKDFLEKRYASYVKLYTEKEKQADK